MTCGVGVEFKPRSPLFVKLARRNGKVLALETHLVQKVLRETALRSGLVDKENNGHDQNPASHHALREAFGSIMVNKGVPDSVVDLWLGHSIGDMAQAYKAQRFEDVKRMYSERERYISITAPESEVIEEVRQQTEEKTRKLRENFDNLYSENMGLKQRIEDLHKRMKKYEKAMECGELEIRGFQRETLERMGHFPEVIEEAMKKHASRKEDYLK